MANTIDLATMVLYQYHQHNQLDVGGLNEEELLNYLQFDSDQSQCSRLKVKAMDVEDTIRLQAEEEEEEGISDPESDLEDMEVDIDIEKEENHSDKIGPEPSTSSNSVGNFPLQNACDDHWSWNPKDHSHEIRLSGPKHRIAHFHPNWSNGTAGVRGTRVLNGGRYYWEVNVSQRIFGTSMMLGIGTKAARFHVDAFINMLGEDDQSWGLSHKGLLWHHGLQRRYTKPFRENVATTIGIYFDGVSGTLTYFKDGVNLGTAFTGLDKVQAPLYPMVCSTAAKTEMSLGVMKREFLNLQDRCRAVTLRQLTKEDQIDQLPLPTSMKVFVSQGLSEDCQEDISLVQNNFNI